MKTTHVPRVLLLTAWLCATAHCQTVATQPQTSHLSVKPQNGSGVYEVGQPITWQIEAGGFDPTSTASYTIKRGGLTDVDHGSLQLVDGATTVTTSLDEPGALLLEVALVAPDGGEQKALGGAIVAPERITPAAARPVDFDAFWAAKLAELAKVPENAKLVPGDSGRPGVEYWKITLDNIRGTHIHGQLARPAKGDKLPALLIPQWAGVYPLEKAWATDRAAEGWLVLNIEAHDLPIDEPVEFYKKQYDGPLQNYWAIGNDDRDTSYFLRMYLSCYQAAEYLTHRPDWDGKTLAVMGTSQGGLQTLMIAGLHPKITAAMALVPAGCDMLGPNVGHRPGWPQWYDQTAGKDPEKVHLASRYYDVVNFASRIKCPVLVGTGLIDQVCPPEGVMAAVNQIDAPTEAVFLPVSAHQEVDGSQRPFNDRCYGAWLPALRSGNPAPVKKN
jgi:cephalosporin-C deacetylase-like acetyl esterase